MRTLSGAVILALTMTGWTVADRQPSPGKSYKLVSTVAGKLDEIDTQSQTVTIEITTRSGRYNRKEHLSFPIAEGVKYRTMVEPVLLDDNGKPRKPTAAEKREWKGPDPKLPGYTTDLEGLKRGAAVQLQLSQDKSEPTPKPKKGVAPEQPKLYVTMVIVTADSEGPPATQKKK